MSHELQTIRTRMRAIDEKLLTLISERHIMSMLAAESKEDLGQPIRNPEIEADNLAYAKVRAREMGIPEATVEAIMRILIESSVTVQEAHLKALKNAPPRSL